MSTLIFCVLPLFIQIISAQVIGSYGPGAYPPSFVAEVAIPGALGPGIPPYTAMPYPNPLALESAPIPPCRFGLTLAELAGNGGAFSVNSNSPIAPTGVSVQSENLTFEGPLTVTGTMPFLGSVALEGPLPATGVGAVEYGCGGGKIGIQAEEFEPVAVNGCPGPSGLAMAGYNGVAFGQFGPML